MVLAAVESAVVKAVARLVPALLQVKVHLYKHASSSAAA
jgi:hypothetical protein